MRAYVRFGGPFLYCLCALCRGTWIEKEIAREKPFAFCCCMTLWCDLRHSFVQVVRQLFLRHRLAFEKKAIECVAQNFTIRIYSICVYKARHKKVNAYICYRQREMVERQRKNAFMEIWATFRDVQWRIFGTHLLIGSEIEILRFNRHVPIILHIVSSSVSHSQRICSKSNRFGFDTTPDRPSNLVNICQLYSRKKKHIYFLGGLAPIKRGIWSHSWMARGSFNIIKMLTFYQSIHSFANR